ncbi:MAG: iron-containing alcohol dehydrogenase [Oscillospiraceae bacterium]|nr:iron-containing alcohol dehydrogenase [Oscillospiraceae bacterium]
MSAITAPFFFELPTKIEYGPGCLKTLPAHLKKLGGTRPIVVTDKGIVKAGLLEKVTALLAAAEIPCTVYDGVEANPKDLNVRDGAAIAREFGADCLIALGGGSPIDCAKSIGVLLAHNADDIKKYEGKTAATEPLPLFITIPTTAGTGSELTFSSVITDTKSKYKMTVKSPYTAAALAICDPELTLSVPPMVTAATGVDALTHAIEAYTANCSEPISDAVALHAIRLISSSLRDAFQNGSDIEARSKMLMGSMLAGIAFSHSDVASVHCVAESLGGLYDLPHGMCNAIFLPYVMEYSSPNCLERYADIAAAMGIRCDNVRDGARAAVEAVKQLCRDVKLPAFKELGVDKADFEKIAEMSQRNISTESNPRPMDKQDYLNVLNAAYDEVYRQ